MGLDEQKRMMDNGEPYEGFRTLTLMDYIRILGTAKWRIGLFGLGIGVLALLITFALPNYYRASAVIKPDTPDKTNSGGVLGTLATFGVTLGSSKVEDLEVLFKSRDLAARVFEKYGLWSIVYPDEFDPK